MSSDNPGVKCLLIVFLGISVWFGYKFMLAKWEKVDSYNEMKRWQLLEKQFGVPKEKVSEERDGDLFDDYFKVTTEKGVYKIQYEYDKDQKIKSLQKVIKIPSNAE
ncbi:hypothetical protein CN942_19750 [Bacillus thuringiensis]|uniref:hypothetical protein n=1 Tax=Bacillus thuringiensis TaxID=1428 RepID=UPI000BFC1996|nr:hypothetical protein [Bacillus thuringiensis]PGM04053.1 hypothetical protein CN942_19750 [Bacillus thuringiensis]